MRNEAVFNTSAASRADTTITLAAPADWVGDTVEIYIGFISADGINDANSLYLGSNTVI